MHPSTPLPLVVIQPSRGWVSLQLRDLWAYREVFYFLIWRDLKVRYKQTLLGAAWVVLQPLLTMIVFSIFLGRFGKIPSDGVPYPLFTFIALLPWQFFAHALSDAGNSVVQNQHLITKIYFPRLIIPLAAVCGRLADVGISMVILIGLLVYYGVSPTMALLTLPLFILLAMLTTLAVGLWLAALNVRYRDVTYAIPFLTQAWLFATPVAYPSSLVPEAWRALYALNPMAGVVEGFRWALLGTTGVMGAPLAVSVVVVIVLLIGGLIYFRRTDTTFADVV